MQETQVQFLGREDPLEKEMATHSRILDREIPWTEEPGGPQSTGSQRVGHDLVTEHYTLCAQHRAEKWETKSKGSSSLSYEHREHLSLESPGLAKNPTHPLRAQEWHRRESTPPSHSWFTGRWAKQEVFCKESAWGGNFPSPGFCHRH